MHTAAWHTHHALLVGIGNEPAVGGENLHMGQDSTVIDTGARAVKKQPVVDINIVMEPHGVVQGSGRQTWSHPAQ